MKSGFHKQEFMTYLKDQFPDPFSTHFTWDMVENLIDYAEENENHSKDQLCYFLSDILPEVEFGEVAAFMPDELLTANGQSEKQFQFKRWQREEDARSEDND